MGAGVEHAARQRYGLEVQATATNDGIVLRVPDTESEPPSADLLSSIPRPIESVVTDEVGGSALFAARFRECAARALLLPRRDPKSRSPLWQQRMRSAQLLSVAARFPEFPIVLETMRECLTDVFDLDGLLEVQREIAAREIRLVEVETKEPSPFARSLLFGYVGAFVYEGDVPLAEKKAAALSLDATLLAELLGKDGLKQLLDGAVIARSEADVQGLSPERQAGTVEQLYDLIRTAGPYSRAELRPAHGRGPRAGGRPGAAAPRPAASSRCASPGVPMVAVAEDVPRLRDGLGIPVPPGVAANFSETSPHPIEDLVLRWARTHGPFVAGTVAARYGLGRAVVEQACDALVASGTVVSGSFVDLEGEAGQERRQYCHGQVLALIKRRTLALLRKEVEPVEQVAYARFLTEWQGVGTGARGGDAVLGALEQLAGYAMPASAVESVILPARVSGYSPAMLDELTASGEVTWVGDGGIGDSDGWVRWYVAGAEPSEVRAPAHHRSQELLDALAGGGAYFFDALLPPGSLGSPRRVRRGPVGPRLVRPGHRGHVRAGPGAVRRGAPQGTDPADGPHAPSAAGRRRARPAGPRAPHRLPDDGRPVVAGRRARRRLRRSGSRPTSSPSSTATAW